MIIQLNSDNNLVIHEEYRNKLDGLLTAELSRFYDSISRLEVHLSDENGGKIGVNDKRCMLEARKEGKSPIAVIEVGATYDTAISGALDKMKALLSTKEGKLKSKRDRGANGLP